MNLVTRISALAAATGALFKGNDSRLDTLESAVVALQGGAPVPGISINLSQMPSTAKVGIAYSGQATATNTGGASGSITYSATGLPNGLAIDQATGSVSGTPTADGSDVVVVYATNGAQSVSGSVTITVAAADVPTIALDVSGFPASMVVGAEVSGNLSATLSGGATGPVSFGVDILPPGVSVNDPVDQGAGTWSAGLSGSPTLAGTGTATITATNGQVSDSKQVGFVVNDAPSISLTLDMPNTAKVGVAYSGQATAQNVGGATGSITFSATGLPTGLVIDSATGAVSGVPTASGSGFVEVTATNGVQSVSASQAITVAGSLTEIATVAATPVTGYDELAVTFTNVKDGDTLIVFARGGSSSTADFTFIDDASHTYAVPKPNGVSNANHPLVAYTRAVSDHASVKVTINGRKPGPRTARGYLLRDQQVSIDPAGTFYNVYTSSAAGAARAIPAYDPGTDNAFDLLFDVTGYINTSTNTGLTVTNGPHLVADASTHGGTVSPFFTVFSQLHKASPSDSVTVGPADTTTNCNLHEILRVSFTTAANKQTVIMAPASPGTGIGAPVTPSGTTGSLVQAARDFKSGSSANAVMPGLATAGNLLLGMLSFESVSSVVIPVPAGWSVLGTGKAKVSLRTVVLLGKIANGTEQFLGLSIANSTYASAAIQEWSGVKLSAMTQAIDDTRNSSIPFGPSSAPAAANSLVALFASTRCVQSPSAAFSAGITSEIVQGESAASTNLCAYGYSAPSDQPLSGTLSPVVQSSGTVNNGAVISLLTLDTAATCSIDPSVVYAGDINGGSGSGGTDTGGGGTGGTGGGTEPPPALPGQPDMTVTPRAFTASELYWSDTTSTDVVDVKITLTQQFYYTGSGYTKTRHDVALDSSNTVLTLNAAPLGVTPLKLPNNSDHLELAVARYKDCVVIENIWLRNQNNYVGRLEVTINGSQVFAQDGVVFDFRCRTAPIRTGLPQRTPSRTFNPNLIPNYGTAVTLLDPVMQDEIAIAGVPPRMSINGIGYSGTIAMGNTGGRRDIGLLPGWVVPYLAQGSYYQALRDGEDHAAVWPVHLRDPQTGMIIDPSRWYDATFNWPDILNPNFATGHYNPVRGITNSPYLPNAAHLTHFGAAGYVTTGSDFDQETMIAWAGYCCLEGGRSFSNYDRMEAMGATREVAWVLTQYGFVGSMLPSSHPYKQVYATAIHNSIERHWTNGHAPGQPKNNQFGLFLTAEYGDTSNRKRGTAPWMNHYLAAALHQLVRQGFTEATAWRDFSAGFVVNSMYKMCYQMGTMYNIYMVDPANTPVVGAVYSPIGTDLLGSWEAAKVDTILNGEKNIDFVTQLGMACGSMTIVGSAAIGEMYASGSFSDQSYPGMMTPGMVAAVDAGIPHAEMMYMYLNTKGAYAIKWGDSAENYTVPAVAYNANPSDAPFAHPDMIVCNATQVPSAPPGGAAFTATLYAVRFGALAGAVTFTTENLPAWMTVDQPVDNGNGVVTANVSGKAPDLNAVSVKFTATCGAASDNQTIVIAPVNPLTIAAPTGAFVAGSPVDSSVTVTCTADATNVQLSASALPAGLSLSTTPVVTGNKYKFSITGAPSTSGSTKVTFTATVGSSGAGLFTKTLDYTFNVT